MEDFLQAVTQKDETGVVVGDRVIVVVRFQELLNTCWNIKKNGKITLTECIFFY